MQYVGAIVQWESELWYVDNCDEDIKDESDETSVYLIPFEYKDRIDEIFKTGEYDAIGYWVNANDICFLDGE